MCMAAPLNCVQIRVGDQQLECMVCVIVLRPNNVP